MSRTGSAADVAYVALSNMVAVIAFSLFAGTLVDRGDQRHRRRMMIYSDAFRAASIAVMALKVYLAGFSLPLVLAVSFVLGTFTALFYPAQRSLLPTLIRPEEVADANGLILTANSVFQAVANGVGGALVAIRGWSYPGPKHSYLRGLGPAVYLDRRPTGAQNPRPAPRSAEASSPTPGRGSVTS